MINITVGKDDGIGSKLMDATLKIFWVLGVKISPEEIEVGEKVYLAGNTSGIKASFCHFNRKNKISLKAHLTSPQGGEYKSLNVSNHNFWALHSSVKSCKSLNPFLKTKHLEMDIVFVRENEEDLFA